MATKRAMSRAARAMATASNRVFDNGGKSNGDGNKESKHKGNTGDGNGEVNGNNNKGGGQ